MENINNCCNHSVELSKQGRHPKCCPVFLQVLLELAAWILIYVQLDPFSKWFTYNLLGLKAGSHLGGAIEFFVADAPKVLMLLVLITFIVGIITTFLTPERIREMLVGRRGFAGYVLAALLGVPTPFCSCSAIPLFLGFLQSGIPLGVTMSFLISCPVVNEVALALLYGMYGWKIAALYALFGVIKAVIAGMLIAQMKPERYLEPWVAELQSNTRKAANEASNQDTSSGMTWSDRIDTSNNFVRETLAGVWHYLVAGIAIGALIYGYIPVEFVGQYMGKESWWNVPVAVVLGLPLYASAAGVIPIIQALLAKGAALGTVLAFMMSVIGISIPELVMLRKVIKMQLIWIFVGLVALGSVIVGYLFNVLIP
ncbi:MAG: permease [Vulcanimicrobiota bacterium]